MDARQPVFAVGDRVVVRRRDYRRESFDAPKSVARVLKKYLETDDGAKYTLDGQSYPRSQGYSAARLVLLTPAIEAGIANAAAMRLAETLTGRLERALRSNALDVPTVARVAEFLQSIFPKDAP